MSNDTIRVGVVGAGANTRTHHIPKLQAIDGVEVISVCNRSRESSERAAQEFGIPTIYENWQELVAASDTNAIVIGTWPYMHCRVTLAGLAAGKHVMCEARMAMNAQEAHAMRNASRENTHLVTQIVPSPFSLRVDNTIKRLIADGYIGDVYGGRSPCWGHLPWTLTRSMHWREDFNLSGFNIMTMGIWYEALLRWVGEATSVMAMGKTYVRMRKDEERGYAPYADSAARIDIVADLACGAQMHVQISNVAGLVDGPEAFIFGSDRHLAVCQQQSLRWTEEMTTPLLKFPSPLKRKAVGGWKRNLSVRFVGMRSSPIPTLKMA